MKRILAVVCAAMLAAIGVATPAAAVTVTIGNDATNRTFVDSWQNFTIVDTNHPAPFDGYFTSINYFAEVASRTIRFVVVDPNGQVTWVSEEVTPTTTGPQTVTLVAPVGVTAGSNLGVYSKTAGAVSFDLSATADLAYFEDYNAGLPALGETLEYVGSSKRFYSMNASVTASSPEICKNGGWESYGYPNQGQCIASVVANERAGK